VELYFDLDQTSLDLENRCMGALHEGQYVHNGNLSAACTAIVIACWHVGHVPVALLAVDNVRYLE